MIHIFANNSLSSPSLAFVNYNDKEETVEITLVTNIPPMNVLAKPYTRATPLIKPVLPTTKVEDEHQVDLVFTSDNSNFADLVSNVREGLVHYPPELSEEGVNGTYFLRNANGEKIAVFKPHDEEGRSQNNPKGIEDDYDANYGIPQGEGVLREVAAYRLDKDTHFSGVPRTTLVTLRSPDFRNNNMVLGSLQEFVTNDGDLWDIGPGMLEASEVEKIAFLDLRLWNNDRHAGNILRKGRQLIPIDHGAALPVKWGRQWWEWQNWSVVERPPSPAVRMAAQRLDPIGDAKKVAQLGLGPAVQRTVRLAGQLLQLAMARGVPMGTLAGVVVGEKAEGTEALVDQWWRQAAEIEGMKDVSTDSVLPEAVEAKLEAHFLRYAKEFFEGLPSA